MKTQVIRRLLLAGLLALGGETILSAQILQPATPEWEAAALGRLTGQTIRANNDEPISTVTDYLIEPRSGQLRFAVVPSGAGSGGETYRLVPMAALDRASNEQGLKLTINRAQWDRVGTLAHDFIQDQVSIDNEHRRRLAQQFGVNAALPGDGSTAILVRAGSLKGRPVQQSGGETIGTVNDVVIDFTNRTAWALVSAANNTPGAGRNYLFPLDRMQISEGHGAISTNLSRNDFAPAQAMMPTGFPSQGQNMTAAISAVQQAVQNVSRGGVQVVPENRLVLRGNVDNDQQRQEVVRAATQAAPGIRVDNEINVRSRW